jgi:hypothetical protein
VRSPELFGTVLLPEGKEDSAQGFKRQLRGLKDRAEFDWRPRAEIEYEFELEYD